MVSAPAAGDAQSDAGRLFALAKLCLAVVLSLTTWFSATAVLPQRRAGCS